jgi:2'-hydroxyisoflavone reductase
MRQAPHPATRLFIFTAALFTGIATALAAGPAPSPDLASVPKAGKPLDILILGGTGFIGPHMVEYAVARGHHVTLFNRGKSRTDLFPEIPRLVGDRDDNKDEGLSALRDADTRWDAVIDNSGYVTRHVRDSATALKDKADRYLFISSISVFPDLSIKGLSEDDAVGTLEDPSVEQVTGQTYGPLKAYCEQAAREVFGDRATIVRPGLIVGPGDPTDRFSYWPVRIGRGGEVLAPGDPTDPVQFIDARDLARFCVTLLENDTGGTFNACGIGRTVTISELIETCKKASGSDATFTWVSAEFLLERGVQPWGHLPVWAPGDGDAAGINTASNALARQAGLVFRTPAETIADVLAWFPGERENDTLRAGWSVEDEADMLARWKDHQAGVDENDHGDHGDHDDHEGHDH